LDKKKIFGQKQKFWTKTKMLDKNVGQKQKFWTKIKFWTKTKILDKNKNFG